MFENLIFLSPIYGYISFTLGMILLFWFYKTKNNYYHFEFLGDIERVFGSGKKYFYVQIVSLFLLITLLSAIFADPNMRYSQEKITKNGIDIVLVVDLSLSMIAEDIKPNRLEIAKQVIADFTSSLQTDRVGLVLFSGKPFILSPLTFDYTFITDQVKNISINSINQDYPHLQGTAIGDGLLYGAHLFQTDLDNDEREKVIVLLTDGEANRGIDPLDAIKYVKDLGIKVHTVGIGGQEDTYIIVNRVKMEIGGIDEGNLKAIANMTGGEYFRADSENTFHQIFESLDLLDKKEIEVEKYEFNIPYTKPFLYSIFLIFLVFFGSYLVYFSKN